ncbi:MAG: AI-2E family transporter [Betaproteobacteria bacterium]
MPLNHPPQSPASSRRLRDFTPGFLLRMRVRERARLAPARTPAPTWLDWNFVALLLVLVAFGLLLWLLSPILAPFLAAAILAYIFDPLVAKLEAKGVSRTIATVIALLVLMLAVLLLLLIVLPLFYKEILQLVDLLPGLGEQLKTRVVPWLNEKLGTAISLDAASFRQIVTDNMADASGIAKRIFSSLSVGGMAFFGFLINLMLIPVVLFYVLRDWRIIVQNVNGIIPRRMQPTVTMMTTEIDAVLSEFLRGQLSVMVIMAVLYVSGLWLVGLELALPVGLITGLLVFVPYLGSGTGLLLGTVAALMQTTNSSNVVVLVWLVFAAGQLIEGFLVTPWLVGDRIGLHPVVVIFALLAFGQVFGFFGLLLALPASAAILVGLRHLHARYRSSTLYS